MTPRSTALLALALLVCSLPATARDRILIYTRNGVGYVHKHIPVAVSNITEIAKEIGVDADHSDDASIFTDEKLKPYKAIVFASSNNRIFENEEQRAAFQRFVRSGRGIVGTHIASGSERDWPYFQTVMGGRFLRHPKLQPFTIRVKDRTHPATRHLPAEFEWEDECYYHVNLNPDLKVLLVTDPAKLEDPQKHEYPGDRFGDSLPLSWYNTVEGGRQYFTALGHKEEHYSHPYLRGQIRGGLLWVLRKADLPDTK